MKEENFLENFYYEKLAFFRTKNIHELIDIFNSEVGGMGWTGTRGAYLSALRTAFEELSIKAGLKLDKRIFIDRRTTSFNKKITLKKGKIIPIRELSVLSNLFKLKKK